MEIKDCKNNFLGCCHLFMDGCCSSVKINDCPRKKEATNNYTRKWMRDCLTFWQRQYREVRKGDEKIIRKLGYEEALIMVTLDCKTLFRSTPHWMDEPYKESDVCRLFNTEFSESYELCRKKRGSTPGGPYKIIPNYKEPSAN